MPVKSPSRGAAAPPLEALVDSTPAFLFALRLDGRYLYCNRASRGSSPNDNVGKSLEDVLEAGKAARVRAAMRRVERTRRPLALEISVRDAAGRARRCAITLSPFYSAGKLTAIVGVGMDVSAAEREPADPAVAVRVAALTPKQRQVLSLVAEGLSSREIGKRMGVSERTVETHRELLMDRLEIRGVAALARFALSAGLL